MPVRPTSPVNPLEFLEILNQYAKDPDGFKKAIERFASDKAAAAEARAKADAANRELDQRIRDFEANKRRQAEWLEEEQRKLGRTTSKYEKLSTGLANRIQRSRDEKERLRGVRANLEVEQAAVDNGRVGNGRLKESLEAREEQLKEARRLLDEGKTKFEGEKTEHRRKAAALKKNLSEVMD